MESGDRRSCTFSTFEVCLFVTILKKIGLKSFILYCIGSPYFSNQKTALLRGTNKVVDILRLVLHRQTLSSVQFLLLIVIINLIEHEFKNVNQVNINISFVHDFMPRSKCHLHQFHQDQFDKSS